MSLDQGGVDGFTAVVGDPDLLAANDAGLLVDRDLRDVSRRRVGGRCADGAASVVPAHLAGAVAPGRPERSAALGLRQLHDLLDAELASRVTLVVVEAEGDTHLLRGDLPVSGHRRDHLVPQQARGLLAGGSA